MCGVKVNKIPRDTERYVVARLVDAELWFWGSWSDEESAQKVALELENGLVLEKLTAY